MSALLPRGQVVASWDTWKGKEEEEEEGEEGEEGFVWRAVRSGTSFKELPKSKVATVASHTFLVREGIP